MSHNIKWEMGLEVGSKVEVRWTNSHQYFKAPGEIVKLNKSSCSVKLLAAVEWMGWKLNPETGKHQLGMLPYLSAGHVVKVPLFASVMNATGNSKWSSNNGVFEPVGA